MGPCLYATEDYVTAFSRPWASRYVRHDRSSLVAVILVIPVVEAHLMRAYEWVLSGSVNICHSCCCIGNPEDDWAAVPWFSFSTLSIQFLSQHTLGPIHFVANGIYS